MKLLLPGILLFVFFWAQYLYPARPQEYYFVFLTPSPAMDDIDNFSTGILQKAHTDNTYRLYESGFLKLSATIDGEGILFILRALSLQEAKDTMATDAMVQAGVFRTEYLNWAPLVCGFCDYPEPAEMVEYYSIRYIFPDLEQTTDTTSLQDEYRKGWQELSDSLRLNTAVLMDGLFTDNSGAFMIIKSDDDDFEAIIKNSAIIKNYNIKYQIRTITLPKGSFCER